MGRTPVIPLAIISGLVLCINTCGPGKLSRREAATQIRQRLRLPASETRDLLVDYSNFGDVNSSTTALAKAGLLTYTNMWIGMVYHVEAEPTEVGRQYVASGKYAMGDNYTKGIKVRVATLDFGEVTGILETGVATAAQVNYTLIRNSITPFGQIAFNAQEGVVQATAVFMRYDDGWRIQELGFDEASVTPLPTEPSTSRADDVKSRSTSPFVGTWRLTWEPCMGCLAIESVFEVSELKSGKFQISEVALGP